MKNEYEIVSVQFTEEGEATRRIRKTVFIDEQAVPESEEWDEFDHNPQTIHLLAKSKTGKPSGCLRIVFTSDQKIKITRIAVLKEYRRKGTASALLKKGLRLILSSSFKSIYLHAQIEATTLYQKFGFEPEGQQFLEAGIVHQTMIYNASKAENIDLIYGNTVERLSYPSEFIHHTQRGLSISRRTLCISSLALKSNIYAAPALIDAISAFVRSDRNSMVRILVQEARDLHEQRTPLIELARRLPSKIEIRLLHKDTELLESFICVDKKHLVFFNDENQINGFCCYRGAPESQALLEKFDYTWNHLSEIDPNISQISL